MISGRLKSLVKYINVKDKVIDIGTDHALLPIYLIKNKVLKTIVIADNKETALNNGINNIKLYKLTKQIIPKLGNGLAVIDKNINTVIISGIGGQTIIKILSHPNLIYLKKIILQPSRDYLQVRKHLINKGYYIKDEEVILDKGRYYLNIVFKKGNKKYSKQALKYGPILIHKNKEYHEYLLKKQEYILKNIPKHKIVTIIKTKKEINILKKIISKIRDK